MLQRPRLAGAELIHQQPVRGWLEFKLSLNSYGPGMEEHLLELTEAQKLGESVEKSLVEQGPPCQLVSLRLCGYYLSSAAPLADYFSSFSPPRAGFLLG